MIPVRQSRSRRLTASLVTFVLVLALVATAFVLERRSQSPPLTAAIASVQAGPSSINVTLRLTARDGAINVHVAVIPGESLPPVSRVLVFYDPAFFLRFGTTVDVVGLEDRLSEYLSALSPSIPVSFVDSAQLPTALSDNPNAAFIDFCYATLPDTVLSTNSTLLHTWISGGGTLIWAGGPLAFFEGNPTPTGGFQYEDLGWSGQSAVVGFPLEDSIGDPAAVSAGPLLASNESSAGSALGISYDGTPDGANTTELAEHNGTDLGFDSAHVGEAAPRTSLAFVPVGDGRVFFFGGAIWGDGEGIIPNAAGYLASDIALLLETGYFPLHGPSVAENVTLHALTPTLVTLRASGQYTHMIALVTSTAGPISLFLWSRQVA